MSRCFHPSACCACLTELVLNDTNAQQIAQANGVYCLGLLVLPPDCYDKDRKYVDKLQVSHRISTGVVREKKYFSDPEKNPN